MRYPTPARWRVKPLSGHDGDTIYLLVDKGGVNETNEKWRIRLKDVFAPELGEPGAFETLEFVNLWLVANSDNTEWPFYLETFRTPRSDKDVVTLGRYVGVVTAANGRVLNSDIIEFIAANGYGGGIGDPNG